MYLFISQIVKKKKNPDLLYYMAPINTSSTLFRLESNYWKYMVKLTESIRD